jgi:dihydroneopterin aldolase
MEPPKFHGLVPDRLRPRNAKIVLDSLEVMADIGFHQFEIGSPQRLFVTVEVWLEEVGVPHEDNPDHAWDYDYVRAQVIELAQAQRYNLQETLAHAIYSRLAAMRGVAALRVTTSKPDIYPDARGVGVEVASFSGSAPN